MRALTLWQPWGTALVYGPKDVENRPWRPGPGKGNVKLIRPMRLAIHAGKKFDADSEPGIRELWPEMPTEHAQGAILGVVEFTAFMRGWPRSRWAFGPWCWLRGRTWPLSSPIPNVKGALGLWKLPLPVVDQLQVLLLEAEE